MENQLTPEMIEKAKQAKSAEELLALAEENNIKLSEEEAENYFEQLTKTGEMSDEELDNVSGGGCQIDVDGKKYTAVTNNHKCNNFVLSEPRGSHFTLKVWRNTSLTTHTCAYCQHLAFKGKTGYCLLSGE